MGASLSTPPLSAADLKRATTRCEIHARAYWACAAASQANAAAEARAVSASLSSAPPPTRPTAPEPWT